MGWFDNKKDEAKDKLKKKAKDAVTSKRTKNCNKCGGTGKMVVQKGVSSAMGKPKEKKCPFCKGGIVTSSSW